MPPHVSHQLTSQPCALCDNTLNNYMMTAEENMYGLGKMFDYLRCGRCGVLHITQVPSDLASYYKGDDYYSVRPVTGLRRQVIRLRDRSYAQPSIFGRWLQSKFPNSALDATMSMVQKRDARILDVGCGGGSLLRALETVGFRDLQGVDPLIKRVQKLGSVNLFPGTLTDISGEFDAILFHHSLEHMPDQLGVMAAARQRLAPHGRVLICIPTVDSFAFDAYGKDWGQLDAPRHLYLHSHRSIRELASTAGFQVSALYCNSQPMQFWSSEMHKDGHPLISEHLAAYKRRRSALFRQLTDWANSVGRGDQIAVQLQACPT